VTLKTKKFRHELLTLLKLSSPEPAQLRRIAELTELLYDEETSRIWWEKAAAQGDPSAQCMLEADVMDHEEAALRIEALLTAAALRIRQGTEPTCTCLEKPETDAGRTLHSSYCMRYPCDTCGHFSHPFAACAFPVIGKGPIRPCGCQH
jgi:hypothetical protein